mmetsp:Transcript_2983/g.6670  ORF Transcript_2983/g.6670 Transcript_2983/m.6670 type:complete len:110 (-) Transcript_2983:57-386(-)
MYFISLRYERTTRSSPQTKTANDDDDDDDDNATNHFPESPWQTFFIIDDTIDKPHRLQCNHHQQHVQQFSPHDKITSEHIRSSTAVLLHFPALRRTNQQRPMREQRPGK